VISKKQIAIRT